MGTSLRLRIPAVDPVITSELRQVLGPGALARGPDGSELVQLRRNLRFSREDWAALSSDDRYRAFVIGVIEGYHRRPVVSHQSAAALWGLPSIGPWPREVHFIVPHASGGRSDPGIRRHAIGVPPADVVDVGGILITSLARTVVDLATTLPLMSAVAAADAALWVPRRGEAGPLVTKAELWQVWGSREFRGKRRAQRVLEFAETGAESAMESASRVNIALAGFPRPVLQQRFQVEGRDCDADFYWPDDDAIGECDGLLKYVDRESRCGGGGLRRRP